MKIFYYGVSEQCKITVCCLEMSVQISNLLIRLPDARNVYLRVGIVRHDNSDIEIHFCPFCGAKVELEKEE